ncbi:MAG: helix-turn-helix domain-containing protein [Candidatus Nanopelagicales bacterium]
MLIETEELIDSAEVALVLGLSQRNSVLTYLNRYPSFPAPVIDRSRIKLWRLQDVQAWHAGSAVRPGGEGDVRDRLLDAARELLAQRPASEVSVRDIATAAGVPHTLLYRHFAGKEGLRRAVVAQTIERVRERIPKDASAREAVLTTVTASLEHAADFRILAFSMLVGDPPLAEGEAPVMTALVRALAAADRDPAPMSDEQCIAILGALVLGWGTFEDRIRTATGLEGSIAAALELVVTTVLQLSGHGR